MTSLLLATLAAVGTFLLVVPARRDHEGRTVAGAAATTAHRRATAALRQAGLESISPRQFVLTVATTALTAGALTALVLGPGVASVLVGLLAGTAPVAHWKRRRSAARRTARDAWPGLIEELRILVGPMGRPVPQALLEVGLRGPAPLRPAFLAAQREWVLSTDFERMVAVLKDRLADPTADATCETLLVVQEVGGELDRRLADLADDRRADLRDRREGDAKQAGARVARWFVVLVPAGMALAGLSVGDGRAAYRTSTGQVLAGAGIALVVTCWWWAGRIMHLPEDERVFDR